MRDEEKTRGGREGWTEGTGMGRGGEGRMEEGRNAGMGQEARSGV